jgi:hypothetical protein
LGFVDDGGWIQIDDMGYVVEEFAVPWTFVQYWQSKKNLYNPSKEREKEYEIRDHWER